MSIIKQDYGEIGGGIDFNEISQEIIGSTPVCVDNRGNGTTNVSPTFTNIPYTKNVIYMVFPAHYQNVIWSTSTSYVLTTEGANQYIYQGILVIIDSDGNVTVPRGLTTIQNKTFTLSGTTLTTTGYNNAYNWALFVLAHN